jgi:hypothetical protein
MFTSVRLKLLLGAVLLCLSHGANAQTPGSISRFMPDPDAVVAIVDGRHVTLRGLDAYSRTSDPHALFLLNRQLGDPRTEIARSVDEERLLDAEAARFGKSVAQLLNERLPPVRVSDAAIRRAFERIRSEQPAASYEQLLPAIRMFLEGQLRSHARAKYLKELARAAERK